MSEISNLAKSNAAAVSSRRRTLERQSSVNQLLSANEVATSSKTFNLSDHTKSASLSSVQSSPDRASGVQGTSLQSSDSQDVSQGASLDKFDSVTSVDATGFSKSGRKRKHPFKPGKHICQYCGRACAKPSVLKKHIRMHTGERPFPCNVCELSFKTKSNLYKHWKSLAHTMRSKEKGISLDSNYGESMSSREESVDMLEGDPSTDADSILNQSFEKIPATVSAINRQSPSPTKSLQIIYLETLRELEKICDAIDNYAELEKLVLLRRSHWLHENTSCIVSIQLQPQKLPQSSKSDVDIDNTVTTAPVQSVNSHIDAGNSQSSVHSRIEKIIRDNNEIVSDSSHGISRRRLSRQNSVSSPANQMFASETPTSIFASSFATPSIQQSPGTVAITSADVPGRDELLGSLTKVISATSMIDPDIKICMHKNFVEVRLSLSIPDVSTRKRSSHSISYGEVILSANNMKVIGDNYICAQCKTSFSRLHVLEIHLAFYCHEDYIDHALANRSHYHHIPRKESTEKHKRKLFKAGSEELSSSTSADKYIINPKYKRSKSDRPRFAHQGSSTEAVVADGVNTKEYLKKHVLKHMGQHSGGSVSESQDPPANLRQPLLYSVSRYQSAGSSRAESFDSSYKVSLLSAPTSTQSVKPAETSCDSPSTSCTNNPLVSKSQSLPLSMPLDSSKLPITSSPEQSLAAAVTSTKAVTTTTSPNIALPSSTESNITKSSSFSAVRISKPNLSAVSSNLSVSLESARVPTAAKPLSSQGVRMRLTVSNVSTVNYASMLPAVAPQQKTIPLSSASSVQLIPFPVQLVNASPVTLPPPSKLNAPKVSSLLSQSLPVTTSAITTSPLTSSNEMFSMSKLLSPSNLVASSSASTVSLPVSMSVSSSEVNNHCHTPVSHVQSTKTTPKLSTLYFQSSVCKSAPHNSSSQPLVFNTSSSLQATRSLVDSCVQETLNSPSTSTLITKPTTQISPTPVSTAHQRLSILRRRFSQPKSRSTVSFDDSVVDSATLKKSIDESQLAAPVVTTTQTSAVSSVSCQSDAIPHGPSICTSIIYQPPSSPGKLLISKDVTVVNDPDTLSPTNSHIIAECQTHYCTLQLKLMSAKLYTSVSPTLSSYKADESDCIKSACVDMTVPLNCYKQEWRDQSYTICNIDLRSILTHSSYWQYKNKMRVMQSMTPSGADVIVQANTNISLATTVHQPIKSSASTCASLVSNAEAPSRSQSSSSTCSINVKELKEIAPPPVNSSESSYNRKNVLLRSISTPNASAPENQSKLIAGGFKSDEDYVYIRGRGKGKYVCQQCGIRCRKPSMLKKHIRTHTDLRPYSCKHCKFSFKTKGNLTKHMRSKAHHRRCLELNIVPVPSTVDDSQIDADILATQQKLSRESKIKGVKISEQTEGDAEASEDEEDNTSDDDSSTDGALHINEDAIDTDDTDSKCTDIELPSVSNASLRRVHSMPAQHMANSFDSPSVMDTLPQPAEKEPDSSSQDGQPPLKKKKKKNILNLSLPAIRNIEDDIARSLLDLSQTPVHANTTPVIPPSYHTPADTSYASTSFPTKAVDFSSRAQSTLRRLSVVKSAKPGLHHEQSAGTSFEECDEPIDLRIQPKPSDLKFICELCRAIFNSQDSLNIHMKLHDGPVVQVNNRSNKHMLAHSGGSLDANTSGQQSAPEVQPQTPNLLKRQYAVSIFDSEADEDGIDVHTKVEPGEKLSDSLAKRKCPYCSKIFVNESYLPIHIKSHHLITQEYVCTYKNCGKKFTNKQDLTYHLGTHALDDSDQYQPISIPKCGICEKTFKSISSLKQHIHHHAEARPHVCEYCDAGFTTAQSLKHHLKTHTQERPYVCGECGATFARSDHLTQHNKTHKKQLAASSAHNRSYERPTILSASGNVSLLRSSSLC